MRQNFGNALALKAAGRDNGKSLTQNEGLKNMRLGSHLTITKGLDQAAALAAQNGANTFQFFTRNPRGGAARTIGSAEIERWQKSRRELDIYQIVGHLPYTVNLAATEPKQEEFARMVLKNDLARVGEFDGELVVSHPGRHAGEPAMGIKKIAALIGEVLEEFEPGPTFCLETMALMGHEIGSVEELGAILKELDHHPKVGVCLDSAHLFAAGWDLRTPDGCRRLVDELARTAGLENVKCMHLNDSKAPLGSRKDRHEKIGRGELGEDGIAAIVNDEFLRTLPLLLETPVDQYTEYAAEIARVKALIRT